MAVPSPYKIGFAKGIFLLCIVWAQLADLVSAVTFRYILTYGESPWVCHVVLSVYINSSNRSIVPEVTIYTANGQSPWCATVTDSGSTGAILTPSVSGDMRVGIYDEGPVSHHGNRQFQIWLNQEAFTDGDYTVPAMEPRITFVTTDEGYPLGVCDYRQGAVEFAQENGQAIRRVSPVSGCPGSLLYRIGQWLVCNIGCGQF